MARGTGVLAGRALRGGRWSLVGLALVVALGGGASLGAAVAAHRTDNAYEEYVESAEVAELVVNPSVRSKAMDQAIRSFDHVESVHVDSLLLASPLITEPVRFSEAPEDGAWLQTLGSVDGRYIDVDRPAVTSGRVPSQEREVFVSHDYRSELERILGRSLDVGDTIEVGFFWGLALDSIEDPSQVIEPIGVEELRVSGYGVLADEALSDELYPRQRLLISPDVTARYYCLPDLWAGMTVEELYAEAFPEYCSTQYDYYSLNLDGSPDAVRSVRDQFEVAATELNEQLPGEITSQGTTYFYISQERAELDAAVAETTRPTVTALLAFAIVAALATLTIAGLMVARQQRRTEEVRRHLRAVGATRSQIAGWSAVPLLLAALAGIIGAVAIALALSPIGPVGTIRSIDPSPRASLPAAVAVPAAIGLGLALAVVIVAVVAQAAWRVARRSETPARPGRLGTAVRRGGPSLSTGIGAVMDGRRGGVGIASMVGCGVATAVTAAAIVFGASLSELVDEPESYGWPWDIAVITGAGYGDTVPAVVEERLAQADVRDDIVDYGYYSFDPAALLDGQAAPMVFGYADGVHASFPVLEGRSAAAAGEAVLGTDTASALGIDVGDAVGLEAAQAGEFDVTVVGLAALPELGAFVSDRTGLGTGAYVLLDGEPTEENSPSLTAIRLRSSTDTEAVWAKLDPDLASWSARLEPPISHHDPVRPAEIVNVTELRAAPLVLGGLLLASLALGLWLAVTLSVRDRRRELAVLRALGFGNKDVRRSVRWQGLTLVAVGVAAGIPLGVIAGRVAWRTFADRLGVVPHPTVPLGWLVVLVLVTLALGAVAVALPARAAARVSPARELLAA